MTSNEIMSLEEADRLYNFSRWGEGYFHINDTGQLCVLPDKNTSGPHIAIDAVVAEMKAQGVQLPAVIRFHDILRAQVIKLNKTFRQVVEDNNYQGQYFGVYPIKVNQMREVVEEIVDAGQDYNYGLEAGSKPELLAVLAHNEQKEALTVLNGYKDEDYIRLALLGRKLGRKIIIVVESFSEFETIIRLAKEMNVEPLVGIRGKMAVQTTGKWASSSGDKVKFGLTTSEILRGIELMKANGFEDSIKLFHFHVGSQIANIRFLKEAVTEGARFFVGLHKLGVKLEYFDVGGGLGIDYDGSRSANDSSRNYSLREYAAAITAGLQEICDSENIPHPNIVSESGRYITAHHSCVISNVVEEISSLGTEVTTKEQSNEHFLVSNMREAFETLNAQNCQEIYHDSQKYKEDAISAFKFGVISLEERATLETLYWQISEKISHFINQAEEVSDELSQLATVQSRQYLCNFSVFQSACDSWAIKQILPVMPITRLNETPNVQCSIADITCDSDGKIKQFIGEDGESETVPMHELKDGEEYHVGLFLTGAYQDVMGDMHNLFGRLNEVHVFSDSDDPENFYIEEIIHGSSSEKVLSTMQYSSEILARSLKKEIDQQIKKGEIKAREGVRLIDFYESCLNDYTYLK